MTPRALLVALFFSTVLIGAILIGTIRPSVGENFSQTSRTVTLTSQGFLPNTLTIRAGDVVTFVNKSEGAFWPASDLHPSHTTYPLFDAREPLPPGSTWEFAFAKTGEWRYHDHLSPSQKGTIIVEEGGVAASLSADDWCKTHPSTKLCWKKELDATLRQYGLRAALFQLARFYAHDPKFADSCHSLAHDMGIESYKLLYLKDPLSVLTPEASACGNGFYHGFMEAFLTATRQPDKARAFCSFVGDRLRESAPDAELQCHHGIGHGALELGLSTRTETTPSYTEELLLTPALRICREVAQTDQEMYRCASGAFNGIANLYVTRSLGLTPDAEDPLRICRKFPGLEESCYGNMNTIVASLAEHDLSREISYIELIPEEKFRISSMRYVAGLEALQLFAKGPESTLKACKEAGEVLATPCIQGVVHGLLEHGEPGKEENDAIVFCRGLPTDSREKTTCFHYLLSTLTGWFPEEKGRRICEMVEKEYQEYCPTWTHL